MPAGGGWPAARDSIGLRPGGAPCQSRAPHGVSKYDQVVRSGADDCLANDASVEGDEAPAVAHRKGQQIGVADLSRLRNTILSGFSDAL